MKDKEFTIDDQIAILKAYKKREKIQFHNFIQDEWYDLEEKDHSFNFNENVYRIKPVTKYVPYDSAKEVYEEMKVHGNYLKTKRLDVYTCEVIREFNEVGMFLSARTKLIPYSDIVRDFEFADGTPFGRKEGEE